jgi:hypothetical protein
MATIPLPALHLNPIAPPPSPLEEYAKVMGIKAQQMQLQNEQQESPLRMQALQNQVQSGNLQNQTAQQDMAARAALNQAYQGAMTKGPDGTPTFDSEKLASNLASGPAAYKTPEVMAGITKYHEGLIDLQKKAADLQTTQADMLGSAATAVKAANYDPTLAHSLLDTLPQSPQLNALRQQIDNPQALKQLIDTAIQNSPAQQKMQNEQIVAKIRANTPEAQEMASWMQTHPHPDGTSATPADYQQFKIDQQVRAHVAEETNPQVVGSKIAVATAEAKARQALQDGDPNSAAQLLISGEIAPSQIISSRKPEFAQKAFQAAHDLSGGQWNAQTADANFKVAQSPENTRFFGSAKSLTDPGGTLDQLSAIGKTIPQNQIPAFNSIADWEKAQSGSGPVAKFAATALGVADDYAKVIGGGVGSDASRKQILDSLAAKQSPEQRQAALDGVRAAVQSQINARIGNNTVMRNMYGAPQGSTTQQAQRPPKVGDKKTFPNGKIGVWDGQGYVAQ